MMSSSVTPILPGTMAWSEKLVQYPQNALVYEVQFYHSPYMFIYVHIFSYIFPVQNDNKTCH